jgi:hypothetical protein
MAPRQQTERPGPRREKKRQPRGEGAGLEDKNEIRDKETGGGEREEMLLQGSEPQVSLTNSLINKGIVPVGDGG